MRISVSSVLVLLAVCLCLAMIGGPVKAGDCPQGFCQPSYAQPQVLVQPQAVAYPTALFVVPGAPTAQLNIQQYSYQYAAPAAIVQPVVVKQQVQRVQIVEKVQKQVIQQQRVKPQRITESVRTRTRTRIR